MVRDIQGKEATYPLTEVLDLWIPERKRLHLLTQLAQLALRNLLLLNDDPLVLPPGSHALLLARQEETQALALGLVTRRPADTVDVHVDVFRAIELNHPVDRGEIEPARGNVGTDQEGVFGRGEALENVETGRLFLLAV